MTLTTPSLRARILLVVLAVAVVPLGLVGLWLTRGAARSGEDLLRARLDQFLKRVVADVGANWLRQRSDLLFLTEDDGVQEVLDSPNGLSAVSGDPPASLRHVFESLQPDVLRAVVRNTTERAVWVLERAPTASAGPGMPRSPLVIDLPINRRFPPRRLGTLEADLEVDALLSETAVAPTAAGMVLAAFDRARGTQLLAIPFDPALLEHERFTWGGDEWLAVERLTTDPGLRLVAAAPLSPFVGPFERAARRGTWWLAAVALAGVCSAILVTRGLTRELERLAEAADRVSRGELETRIEEGGTDEVARVAKTFNSMAASLKRTLAELAARERLAAVGEFAASLAHEIRNPLTAIRVDLQRVEEALPAGSPLREPQARALEEIERLDATVGDALGIARARQRASTVVRLEDPLHAAANAAEPAFSSRHATLLRADANPLGARVRGERHALEQLFLNLLLNAAAALQEGGRAWLEVEAEGRDAVVRVSDNGAGVPPDVLERIFEPLFSSRMDGTGLGLTIARRIAEDHGGSIEIESQVGSGTCVRVRLPLAPEGAD